MAMFVYFSCTHRNFCWEGAEIEVRPARDDSAVDGRKSRRGGGDGARFAGERGPTNAAADLARRGRMKRSRVISRLSRFS